MLLKPNNLFFKRPTTTQQSRTKYRYDGLNRRVVKDLPSGTDVRYLYNGWRSIQEVSVSSPATVMARYVYGLTYLDEVIRMDRDADGDGDIYDDDGSGARESYNYYFVQDLIYNTVALVDDSGAVAERYWYEPYGKATFADSSGAALTPQATACGNEHLFTGQRYCAETKSTNNFGLYYYKNRYYDAVMGRFVCRDPMGYEVSLNLTEYVVSRPVRLADPLGLYGRETHFVATNTESTDAVNAAMAGKKCNRPLCWFRATDIAVWDQRADENGNDAASALDIFKGRDLDKYNLHFPGAGLPGFGVEQNEVKRYPDNPVVGGLLENAIKKCDIKDMGFALHSLQDSFAHQGKPSFGGHPAGRPLYDPDDPNVVNQSPKIDDVFHVQWTTLGGLDDRVDKPEWDRGRHAAAVAATRLELENFWTRCICQICCKCIN